MCLRSWIDGAIEKIAVTHAAGIYTALGEMSNRLDTISEQLSESHDGLDEGLQNLMRWSITKPPMSIWGNVFCNDGESIMVDIYGRGETLRSVWSETKSFGFKVDFPADNLIAEGVEFGEVFKGWTLKNHNESAPGELTIGAAAGDPANIIDTGNSIFEICTITFSMEDGTIQNILRAKDMVDGLALFSPKEFEIVI